MAQSLGTSMRCPVSQGADIVSDLEGKNFEAEW